MRKLLTSLLVITSLNVCMAQTIPETEKWIRSIIDDPAYRFNSHHSYSVSFSNGNMIVDSPFLGKFYEEVIPLKSVDKLRLQKLDGGYRLTITCSKASCIKYGEYISNNRNNYRFDSYKKQTIIMFGRSLENDNLHVRLEKALKHLIKSNGGKLIEDPF